MPNELLNRKRYGVLAIVAIALLGLGAYAYYANRASHADASPSAAGSARPGSGNGVSRDGGGGRSGGREGGGREGGGRNSVIGVEAVKVAMATFQDDVAAVGSLKSNESVTLRPEVAGRIATIQLREGRAAAKGMVLVALDASTQRAELQQAAANRALAQANFKRNDELFQKKFISERARDESAATLKVQDAAVALAQAKLGKTQIRAPFAGVVGIRNVSPGDYVKEGQELINIEDISALKVDFRLPENLFSRLQKGQTIEVTTDAMRDQTFKGTVDAIDPMLDAAGRAISLRARLPNPDLKLRPGMFVRVRLAFAGERHGLAVPEEALVPSGSDNYVFKVVDGKATRVKVKLGQRREGTVEIVEGLKEGEQVVTAGQIKLREGAAVNVVAAEKAK